MAHDMVDYEYYANAYLGSLIPPQEFSYQIRRAESYLQRLCRVFQVEGGEDAKAMATCAVAEELYRGASRQGIASASLGGVQVQYRQGDREEEGRRLYRAAGVYLDIYRGRCGDESN